MLLKNKVKEKAGLKEINKALNNLFKKLLSQKNRMKSQLTLQDRIKNTKMMEEKITINQES